MSSQFASRLALIVFATTAIHGVVVRNPFGSTMPLAMIAGAVAFFVGLILGDLARRLVEEQTHSEFQNLIKSTHHHNSNSPTSSPE